MGWLSVCCNFTEFRFFLGSSVKCQLASRTNKQCARQTGILITLASANFDHCTFITMSRTHPHAKTLRRTERQLSSESYIYQFSETVLNIKVYRWDFHCPPTPPPPIQNTQKQAWLTHQAPPPSHHLLSIPPVLRVVFQLSKQWITNPTAILTKSSVEWPRDARCDQGM